jgi:hypothetical protein
MASEIESDYTQPHQSADHQEQRARAAAKGHSRSVVYSSSFCVGADGKGSYREVRGESTDSDPLVYRVKEGTIEGDRLSVTSERTGGVEVLEPLADSQQQLADSGHQPLQPKGNSPMTGGHRQRRSPQDMGSKARFHHWALSRHGAHARQRFIAAARGQRQLSTQRGANEAVASLCEGGSAPLVRRHAHSVVMGVPICEVAGHRVGFHIGHNAQSDGTASLSTARSPPTTVSPSMNTN